jgi:uncharacterized repeat protein (TIGR03847 family)
MARAIFDFDRPERFVAGTVGQPGERTFYLQVRESGQTVSVALEKVQVSLLADRLKELIDELRRQVDDLPDEPAQGEDVGPLDQPVEEEFRVGTLALAWDPEDQLIVVEAQAVAAGDPAEPLSDDPEGPDVLRVRLNLAYARSFVVRAERVVAAGRPPCPLCGLPLDPAGHVCPRMNGHRA